MPRGRSIVRMGKLFALLLLGAVFMKLYPLGFVAPVAGGKAFLQLDVCHANDVGSPGGMVCIPASAPPGLLLVFLCFFSTLNFLPEASIISARKMKPPRSASAVVF